MTPLPYVALLSRPTAVRTNRIMHFIEAVRREGGLSTLYESSTILALGAPTMPHLLLPGGAGVIFGHLFDRVTTARIEHGSLPALDEPAEHFVELYWGGYVALRTRHAAAEVLRDPSGALPCYHALVDEFHIVTSRPDLLFAAGLLRAEIDWTIVTQAIVYRDLKPARTALRGISELLPGMKGLVLPPGLSTDCVWSPWRFTDGSAEIADFAEATRAVQKAGTGCLSAWAKCFDRPLVEISGGLDSAIVAAGLADAGPRLSALTYRAVSGDPDETPYAQAIADHLGIVLEMAQPAIGAVDLTHSDAGDLPRPCARNFSQAFDRLAFRHAVATDADAFFSGGGGDNVFCYLRSLAPLIDRLKRHGLHAGALETVADLATLGDTSVWHVAARTARRLIRRRAALRWTSSPAFLSPAAVAALPFPVGHPWVDAPPGTVPGKRAHVAALIRVQNHLEGHGRLARAPIVSPLLSQPLVETCLATPSWLWCTDGRNRAVARAAFARALPAPVIARQSKGAFDSFSAQLVLANRPVLRNLLLDGVLAGQGLLDKEAIGQALDTQLPDSDRSVALLTIADVEAWARAWQARASERPALA